MLTARRAARKRQALRQREVARQDPALQSNPASASVPILRNRSTMLVQEIVFTSIALMPDAALRRAAAECTPEEMAEAWAAFNLEDR